MKAAVVYESMFGNTRAIAEAVGQGLSGYDVRVLRVSDLQPDDLEGVELIVVGGPTHVRSTSRPKTRRDAAAQAADPQRHLILEPGTSDLGLREWLAHSAPHGVDAAAFDTRVDLPLIVTGAANRSIARQLRGNGCRLLVKPQSFLVSKETTLVAGELPRARAWGGTIAGSRHVAVSD